MPRGFEFDQIYPDTPSVERRKLGEKLVQIVAGEYSRMAETALATGVPVNLSTLRSKFRDFDAGALNQALQLAQEQALFDVDEALDAIYPPSRHRPSADRFRYM